MTSDEVGSNISPITINEIMKRGTYHTMSIIAESHLDIMQSTAMAYIATTGPKGEPQVSPVWFSWDGTHLRFSVNKIRQKYRNLLREPRIAIAIADPTNPYRSVEIRGIVAQIDEDRDGNFADSLSRKYLNRERNADEIQPGEERVVIVIKPERVFVFPF